MSFTISALRIVFCYNQTDDSALRDKSHNKVK